MDKWDYRFMKLAEHVAQWSKDRSTKVGCVIVGPNNEIRSVGYNGFVRGMDDDVDSRHERPAKYKWTEHSERNAVYNAARIGVPLEGCTIYVPWYPCADCARCIVQSGIKKLVYKPLEDVELYKRWEADFVVSREIFEEGGVATQAIWLSDYEEIA